MLSISELYKKCETYFRPWYNVTLEHPDGRSLCISISQSFANKYLVIFQPASGPNFAETRRFDSNDAEWFSKVCNEWNLNEHEQGWYVSTTTLLSMNLVARNKKSPYYREAKKLHDAVCDLEKVYGYDANVPKDMKMEWDMIKQKQTYWHIKDLYGATHWLINGRVITDGEYMYACGCLIGVENTAQSVVQTYKQGSLCPLAVEFLSDWQDRFEKENSWNKKPWRLLRDSSEASIALRDGHSVMDVGGVVFFLQKVAEPDGTEHDMVFSRGKDGAVKLAKPLEEFSSWFDRKDFTLYNEEE